MGVRGDESGAGVGSEAVLRERERVGVRGDESGAGVGGGDLHSTFSSSEPLRKMDRPFTHSS